MLRIALLGEQSVTDDVTGVVHTRSSRTLALVAFLAIHAGSPQGRQRIAGTFWPESTESQALTNLRRELHHLRQTLGDDRSLVVTSRDLCWRDCGTVHVDVCAFDTARRSALVAAESGDTVAVLQHADTALAEYGGELLPGSYDDWVIDARAELQRECVELCALICRTRRRRGELAAALPAARRRIQLEPLDEGGYRTLMELQAGLGDRAGAVRTYHQCESTLEKELGVLPDEATTRVLDQIMAAQRDEHRRAARKQSPGRAGRAAAPLVGRAGEFGALLDVWRATAGGRPALTLVRGGAGVGKTRLVTELADVARREGAAVATARCFGASGRLALAPVAEWLRNQAFRSATASLEPVWREEVGRLVPSETSHGEPASGLRAMADGWQRHRFFEGLTRALLGVGRPTMLVLDNLQWCDTETLAFITFCLGLAPSAPLLVAGTLRTDNLDEEPDVVDWTTRMNATGLLTDLTLRPLETDGTAQLAEAIGGRPLDGDGRALLQAATGGFPLHVVEAMRTVVDPNDSVTPGSDLTAVLHHRMDQVSSAAREIAALAGAVGRDFSLELLTEASDLDADSVVDAVDELWRRRIVQERGDGYDFAHDLLREAAYARVSPPRRWLLHRRLAQSLELLHRDDIGPVAGQLAEQYARGGRPERAIAYYRRAAEVASGIFAHTEAIRLHKEALSIVRAQPRGPASDRQELAVLEAMAAPLNARYGYSSAELHAVLERSVALAEQLGRTESVVNGLIGLWTSRFVQGRVAEAHRTASQALALAAPHSEPCGLAHFALAGAAVSLGMPADAVRHFEAAAALTRGVSLIVGTRADVHSTAWAAHARWLLGDGDRALSDCQEAVDLARALDHPYSLAVALAYAAITHQLRGDSEALRDTVAELAVLCNRYDFGYYGEWGLVLDGWSRGGDAGIALARRGIANLEAAGSFARMPYWLSLLADLLDRAGQPDAARATLDAAIAGARARADVWWLPEVLRARAALDDDPGRAVARLRAAAQLATEHGSVALLGRCEQDLARRSVRTLPGARLPTGSGADAEPNAARTPRS